MNRVSALSTLMLSVLAAATGCSGKTSPQQPATRHPAGDGPSPIDIGDMGLGPVEPGQARDNEEELSESYCQDGEIQFGRVDPKMPFDYLEIVRASSSVRTIMRLGMPCPEGKEPELCKIKLDAERGRHASKQGGFIGSPTRYLVVLRSGNKLRTLTNDRDLKRFFGPVNTAAEAFFWAMRGGYRLTCKKDKTTLERTADGYLFYAEKGGGCIDDITGHHILVTTNAEITALSSNVIEPRTPNCVHGRLPRASLAARPAALPSPTALPSPAALPRCEIGQFAANAAYLEAAAVIAFRELAEELRAFGAPAQLIAQARASIEDEARHARIMRSLAQARGARCDRPKPTPAPHRDAFTLALDNAEEGCVRESYGVLLAMHQERFAHDRDVRAAAAAIAPDELRHAAFSWALHAWLWPQLTPAQQLQVRARMRAAADRFEASLQAPSEALRIHAGLPSRPVAKAMIDQLRKTLWS